MGDEAPEERRRPFMGAGGTRYARIDPDDETTVICGSLPRRLQVELTERLRSINPADAPRPERAQGVRTVQEALEGSSRLPLTVRPEPFVHADSSVFTMGSCFAVNIRRVLRQHGLDVHPRTAEIDLDPAHAHIGRDRALNHYDTFAIRQEVERALDGAAPGFEPLPTVAEPTRGWSAPSGSCWQDAARMDVYADDPERLQAVSAAITDATRRAIDGADVIIISLGLIETWRDTSNGRHAWSFKVAQNAVEAERFGFHLSSYEENLDNVRWVCRALADRRPGVPIVLTVSPVGLSRTFTDRDVTVANTYSKSMLRTVAGAVDLEIDQVRYWPSYEIATRANLFANDLRHISDEGVDYIIGRFLAAHSTL